MKKLDSFSKILIATGTINYMAASLNSVTRQIERIPTIPAYISESVKNNDEKLAIVVDRLKQIMEDLGNYMDGIDAVCAIDGRIYETPFDIIIHGNDNVD